MTRSGQKTSTESEMRIRRHEGARRRVLTAAAITTALVLSAGGAVIATWAPPTRSAPSATVVAPPAVSSAARTIRPSVRRSFIANRGQWDPAVRFLTRSGDETAFFSADAITLARVDGANASTGAGAAVRLALVSASPAARIIGVDRQSGVHNFFVGDAARWRTGVESFGRIRYTDLYDGIDLCIREQGGHLEYDVELAPHADLARMAIRVEGARDLALAKDGSLVIETAAGSITQAPPTTWEVTDRGERRPVACRYRLLGDRTYGFIAPARDPALAMVVDPGIEWSTYIGGSQNEFADAVKLDATGHVIIAGQTTSSNYPTTTGAFDTLYGNGGDAVVSKLDPTGTTLVWSTYLGGSSRDYVKAIELTAAGEVIVTGHTQSSSFPTRPGAYDTSYNGAGDVFLSKLSATGSALLFSTFLGGTGYDEPFGLALDANGGLAVGGLTQSSDFPTSAAAYDKTANGQDDGFVARLDANATTLVASTYLGGNGDDPVEDVVVAPNGVVTVCGQTWAVNNTTTYPTTTGVYDTTYNGGKSDTYVTRLDGALSQLVYSTFLGGTNWDPSYALHLHPNGAVTIAGQTYSANFPATTGAVQTTYGGRGDVYLARFDNTGATLQYATFIGGNDFDEGRALAVDSAGAMTVTGWTESPDYPTTIGAFQTVNKGLGDNYVSRVSPDGTKLFYSSLFGGAKWDEARAIALDGTGAATIAGQVWSNDYPTTVGVIDRTYNSNGDAFVTRLDLLPTGVSKFGISVPSCQGAIALGVSESPKGGSTTFRVTNTNGPPNTAGLLILGFARLANPVPIAGAQLWVSPFAPYVPFLLSTNANGFASYRIPVPAAGRGATVYFQAVWSNPPGCPGQGILSSSNALAITIQ